MFHQLKLGSKPWRAFISHESKSTAFIANVNAPKVAARAAAIAVFHWIYSNHKCVNEFVLAPLLIRTISPLSYHWHYHNERAHNKSRLLMARETSKSKWILFASRALANRLASRSLWPNYAFRMLTGGQIAHNFSAYLEKVKRCRIFD